MAVFTKLTIKDIESFISNYSIGDLENFEEIIEGIENSNFRIFCDNTAYILTIFEKRINSKDLPFFLNLKKFLNNNNFKCPKPISDKSGKDLNKIKGKDAVIISYLKGESVKNISNNISKEIGKMVGTLHMITSNFNEKRVNNLDLKDWKDIYKRCQNNTSDKFNEVMTVLEKELVYLELNWPKNVPCGIIHADLFKDNIFFIDEKITGVIDFYFACYYFYIYDLAIIINDWCFKNNGRDFDRQNCKIIIEEYENIRKLSDIEKDSFNTLLRAAAVRILSTRLLDYIFHPPNAIVIKKNPFEYYNILKWHQQNNIF